MNIWKFTIKPLDPTVQVVEMPVKSSIVAVGWDLRAPTSIDAGLALHVLGQMEVS